MFGENVTMTTQEKIEASEQLEWLWANCKIVYWPKDDRYPIEHNPHSKKYSRDMIEAEMPNRKI